MVILQPHRLEGGVLVDVLRSPWKCLGIGLLEAFSDLFANEGYATEPTVKPIALMKGVLFGSGGHAELYPLLFGNTGRRILNQAILHIRAVATPQRFRPISNRREVRLTDPFMSQLWIISEVCPDRRLKQTCSFADFGYGFSEAGAQAGSHVFSESSAAKQSFGQDKQGVVSDLVKSPQKWSNMFLFYTF